MTGIPAGIWPHHGRRPTGDHAAPAGRQFVDRKPSVAVGVKRGERCRCRVDLAGRELAISVHIKNAERGQPAQLAVCVLAIRPLEIFPRLLVSRLPRNNTT